MLLGAHPRGLRGERDALLPAAVSEGGAGLHQGAPPEGRRVRDTVSGDRGTRAQLYLMEEESRSGGDRPQRHALGAYIITT